MAEQITKDQVRHIAMLSRLECSDEEIELYSHDLNRILGHVAQLSELDTEGVEPMAHAQRLVNVFREDRCLSSLSQDEALGNAAESEDGYFKVPQIIQES